MSLLLFTIPSMAGSNHFSSKIKHNILPRLPAKSVVRCQIVPKSWQADIRDPYIIKPHVDQFRKLHWDNQHIAFPESGVCTSFEMENGFRELLLHLDQYRKLQSDNRYVAFSESGVCRSFEMENGFRELGVLDFPFTFPGKTIRHISSCNGLLLFKIKDDRGLVIECVIWNPYPFAQEWTRIKCPHPAEDYNLWYDEASDDLKIVGFNVTNECVVYSCKNDTWEVSSLIEGEGDSLCTVEQVCFHGAIYCIEAQEEEKGWPLATHIARYDVSNDELESFQIPNVQQIPNQLIDSSLTTSKEALFFYVLPPMGSEEYSPFSLRIWAMNDDYEWEHLMTIDYEHVERINWPAYVYFPNGRNDFVIETRNRDLYSVDSNQVFKNIGKVPQDIHRFNRVDTLHGSSPQDIHRFNRVDTLHGSSLLKSSKKK